MIKHTNHMLQSKHITNSFINKYLKQKKEILEYRLISFHKQNDLYKSAIHIIQNKSLIDLFILTNQLKEILDEFDQYEYKGNLLICHQLFSTNGILQNLFRIPTLEMLDKSIFNLLQFKHDIQYLKNFIDKYEQEVLCRFLSKMNKQTLKQRFKYLLRKTLMRHISLLRKKELSVKNSSTCKYKNRLEIKNIHAFCGQTFDRSSSAYTSKKRSHRHYSSFTKMKDEIDQSTPENIPSRVAEQLDENEIETKNDRDYLTAPNTSSKYKYYSTQKHPSDTSDIYIKLSDCQAACRLLKILFYSTNSSDYSIDVGQPNIINEIKQIISLHLLVLGIEQKNIDIEKQNYLFVIVIFLCLSMLYLNITILKENLKKIFKQIFLLIFGKYLARIFIRRKKIIIHSFVLV